MTVESDKAWYKKIVEVQELTSPVWDLVRPFTKWFFDVLKNIMIVAVLQYTGKKTGNITIKAIVFFSGVLISTYFLSYINMWRPDFLNFKNRHVTIEILGGLLTVATMLGLVWGGSWLIGNVITELTDAQGK